MSKVSPVELHIPGTRDHIIEGSFKDLSEFAGEFSLPELDRQTSKTLATITNPTNTSFLTTSNPDIVTNALQHTVEDSLHGTVEIDPIKYKMVCKVMTDVEMVEFVVNGGVCGEKFCFEFRRIEGDPLDFGLTFKGIVDELSNLNQ
jgi:hypothetical protein